MHWQGGSRHPASSVGRRTGRAMECGKKDPQPPHLQRGWAERHPLASLDFSQIPRCLPLQPWFSWLGNAVGEHDITSTQPSPVHLPCLLAEAPQYHAPQVPAAPHRLIPQTRTSCLCPCCSPSSPSHLANSYSPTRAQQVFRAHLPYARHWARPCGHLSNRLCSHQRERNINKHTHPSIAKI